MTSGTSAGKCQVGLHTARLGLQDNFCPPNFSDLCVIGRTHCMPNDATLDADYVQNLE